MGSGNYVDSGQARRRGTWVHALTRIRSLMTNLARIVGTCLLAVVLAMLPACGDDGDTGDTAEALSLPSFISNDECSGASYALPDEITIPSVADHGGAATIDTSGVAKGWVGARAHSDTRLKFQVVHGEMTYNYDLPNDGTPTCFPINMGDGDYRFRIMENIEGSSYAELDSASVGVTLDSEFEPFLVPNIFCAYDTESDCVKKAQELLGEAENQGQAVREICTYVAENVSYDYDKAEVLAKSTGYIPDADETLKTQKGICFDYACLSAAMLRSSGLPAQVITGYVSPDDLYHAWIMVYVDGTWKSAQFSVEPNTWSRCDVTFASAGADSAIGDGTIYTDRYVY